MIKPHQVEQINYLMTRSKLPQTYWNLRTDNANNLWQYPVPSSSSNQRIVHKLFAGLEHLSLTLPLKMLFWNPADPWVWVFWARAVLNSLLFALHKMLHFSPPQSVDELYCTKASRPMFGSIAEARSWVNALFTIVNKLWDFSGLAKCPS